MPYSEKYAQTFLNYTLGQSREAFYPPNNIYLALFTNDPEADGGVCTELTVPGYERLMIVRWANETKTVWNGETGQMETKTGLQLQEYPSYFGAAEGRTIQNNRQINWAKATQDWPTIKGFGLFTKATNEGLETPEEPFFYGKLDNPITVPKDAVALFDPGSLKITFPTSDQ